MSDRPVETLLDARAQAIALLREELAAHPDHKVLVCGYWDGPAERVLELLGPDLRPAAMALRPIEVKDLILRGNEDTFDLVWLVGADLFNESANGAFSPGPRRHPVRAAGAPRLRRAAPLRDLHLAAGAARHRGGEEPAQDRSLPRARDTGRAGAETSDPERARMTPPPKTKPAGSPKPTGLHHNIHGETAP
jgi:hypothetical protein